MKMIFFREDNPIPLPSLSPPPLMLLHLRQPRPPTPIWPRPHKRIPLIDLERVSTAVRVKFQLQGINDVVVFAYIMLHQEQFGGTGTRLDLTTEGGIGHLHTNDNVGIFVSVNISTKGAVKAAVGVSQYQSQSWYQSSPAGTVCGWNLLLLTNSYYHPPYALSLTQIPKEDSYAHWLNCHN